MRPKDVTILKRFGFEDKELRTPEHDEMFLRLLNKDTLYRIIEDIGCLDRLSETRLLCDYCYPRSRHPCSWDWEKGVCGAGVKEIGEGLEKKQKREEIKKDYLEYKEFIRNDRETRINNLSIKPEYPIQNKYNNFIVGFVDLFVVIPTIQTRYFQEGTSYRGKFVHPIYKCYIEIKPVIKSVGEVIRQINTYKTFVDDGNFVLVTKTPQHKDAFASAGIYIYDYSEMEFGGDVHA